MKTNSNSYTIIYSAILVLIVAFLLAFVFQALKPMQDANVQLDLVRMPRRANLPCSAVR